MSADPTSLLDKIKTLPPQRRAEVEDFVDFLNARERAAATERLGQAFERLDALEESPPTAGDVEAEIRAARAERRAKNADRR
jgi:hypothetical protein